MTVRVAIRVLDSVRVADDRAVASVHGYDIMSTLNYHYENIHESAGGGYAPGASSGTVAGHVHDDVSDGRGILRAVNGAFYIMGQPLSLSSSGGESISLGYLGDYPLDAGAGDYEMGVAYVSPGVTSIKVAFQAKVADATDNPTLTIHNITDAASSAAVALTTDPCWYSTAVAVTHPGGGALYRITLDIRTGIDANSTTFYLYEAFPYEYQDAP